MTGGRTGEEMIREGLARHISCVMDRQTWPGRGDEPISSFIIRSGKPGCAARNNTKGSIHKHKPSLPVTVSPAKTIKTGP